MLRLTTLVLLTLAVSGEAAEMPPPFPRPGTTSLFENDVVAAWNVAWLKQQYPLHTHRYDLIGISYMDGDRIITQGDTPGRLTHTKAWEFQTNRANVTHVEEGASEPPLRAVLIELKRPAPVSAVTSAGGSAIAVPVVGDGPDGLLQVAGPPAWQNNRAAGWVVMPGAPAAKHRHTGDAVEVVFDGSTMPRVTFVPAGTTHDGPAAPEGGRAYIFELK